MRKKKSPPTTRICLSPAADKLQQFAAAELKRYLKRLFGVTAEVTSGSTVGAGRRFIVGLRSDDHVRAAAGRLPRLSDQGHLVRRQSPQVMILAGGSSAAVAWAVYELVEQYGVRYLLHGDVFPENPGAFRLPDVDAVLEPTLQIRSWRQWNGLPTGPEMWTAKQQKAFIRQIFKLKYNGVFLSLWPHQPVVHYECGGIEKSTGLLLFDQKFPITRANIGREHLIDAPRLVNPEFVGARTYEERLSICVRLMKTIIRTAKSLGMHTSFAMQPLEFPKEFRPVLQAPSTESIQLGDLSCAETGDLFNPGHVSLVETRIRAYLDQYSEVDAMYLEMPEHPQAGRVFEQSWRELDARHGLARDCDIATLLRKAAHNALVPGDTERASREFKSSVSMFNFFDRFFASNDILERAAADNIKINLTIGMNAEHLFPIMDRVLWDGAGIATTLGYTASRAVRAMDSMARMDTAKVPAELIVTFQDDNIGSLPQVATHSLHNLVRNMQRHGWRGFLTRYWPIGDLDPVVAFLAKASWDATMTPHAAYVDHFSQVYGPEAVDDMCRAMRILEDITVILDLDFLSLFFPVLTIMCRELDEDKVMPQGLLHVRAMFQAVDNLFTEVEKNVSTERGRAELAYWRQRIVFSIEALNEKELLHEGARWIAAAQRARSKKAKAERTAEAKQSFAKAIAAGKAAVRAMASEVRDDSDRGSLATYFHLFVREVQEQTAAVLAGRAADANSDPM
ncbi:MAG: hypothetical protein QGF67_02795 [Lentisphaeria bacterium]|jgi:hypothetical protein|nr:hypothetical protein [Lentisphaeria bacterium]MDP7740342.1 hypothetical protein [Lentisphaeria bacterium]